MTGKNGRIRSAYYQEDSLANPIAWQEKCGERMTPGTSGWKCLEQFIKYAPHGLLQRTFVALLVGMEGWFSRRCSLTWKLRDTRSFRFYCQLQVSVPRTAGNASGSLAVKKKLQENANSETLLPTPTTGSNRNSRNAIHQLGIPHQRHGTALGLAQAMELTMGILPKEFDNWQQVPDHYRRLLPTPTSVSDAKGGCTRSAPKRQNASLASAMHGIFGITGKTSQLNPQFVMEMMGFPPDWTASPFQSGGLKA